MLFINGQVYFEVCLGTGVLFILFLFYCALSAYRENAKQHPDDSDKKDYPRASLWLTPATPFLWLGRLIILAPWSIVFGVFLVLFPFILIIFHPLPENTFIQRFILKVGNGVLKLNTRLLLALGLHAKPVQFSP
jgi:hypothetical protein